MFDSDTPGRFSAQVAAQVLGSKAKIAELPLKDANEMLVAGRVSELIDATWRAQPYRPEGIIELSSMRERVKQTTSSGLDYVFPELTRVTYGARTGELIGIGAGAGTGKTEFLTELMGGLVLQHREPVGAFFLESTPEELTRRLASKVCDKPFHIPDAGWTAQDLDDAIVKLNEHAKVFLYDSFGVNEWEPIKSKMEYLHHTEGVRFFILDHLTAFAASDPSREREILETVMGDMGSFVKKLPITIFFVSHLATPEGKSHEEGGHVSLRHFKGARAIGFWSHLAFGLERNQQAEDVEERLITTVRCVKNRPFGHLNGEVFYLRYDPNSGRLLPIDKAWVEGDIGGYKDETSTKDDF